MGRRRCGRAVSKMAAVSAQAPERWSVALFVIHYCRTAPAMTSNGHPKRPPFRPPIVSPSRAAGPGWRGKTTSRRGRATRG